MTDELTLAAEFPTPTREDWLALVDKVLKGGDFHKKLVTRTADGIEIQPLYTADEASDPDAAGLPGFDPFTRGAHAAPRSGGAWDVRVPVQHPDLAMANTVALDELLRGATSLLVNLRPGGVAVSSADDLDRLLDGVYLDLLPIALDTGADFTEAAGWLAELWERRGVGGAEVSGSLGADPFAVVARDGSVAGGVEAALVALGALAASTAAQTPKVAAAAIDLGPYVEAGATPAQQLAALLATGVAYLRAMEAAGLDVTAAASQIEARVVVDTDFFGGMALCRAARRLWAAMLAECGVPEDGRSLKLQARTAARVMTERDPWVNLLRVATGTFAAALGGADGIVALPFDVELGLPDDLGRRLARNTHLLLQEESNVGRVLDPAGGSWFVETLTEELATAAWTLFAGIEADGGMAAVVADGSFAAKLDGAWAVRRAAVASRKAPVTGVSEFPLLSEAPVRREPRPAAPASTGGLPVRRDAQDFEHLRDAADAHKASSGDWPRVFLANLGPIAVHTARATWARNFFESGGIEAVGADGFTDAESAAAAFRASGSSLVCLCSSDATYAELAESTAQALKAAGAARVYLAGNPGDARAGYQSAGVDEFVHVGVDVVESLTRAQQTIGVTR